MSRKTKVVQFDTKKFTIYHRSHCKVSSMTTLSKYKNNYIYRPHLIAIKQVSMSSHSSNICQTGVRDELRSRVTAAQLREVSLNKKLNLCQLHRCCSQPALCSKGNHYFPFKQENLYFMKTLRDASWVPTPHWKMETRHTAANNMKPFHTELGGEMDLNCYKRQAKRLYFSWSLTDRSQFDCIVH